jgi:hypothetical protein
VNPKEDEMAATRWWEKYAWIVFAAIGVMGLLVAAPVMLDPGAGAAVFEQLDGLALPAVIAGDPAAMAYAEHLYRFAFGATVGVDLLTVLVAVFAFRHGARWAWFALWYWPVLFGTNALAYDGPARYVQLFMLMITTAALAAAYGQAWRRTPVAPSVATA